MRNNLVKVTFSLAGEHKPLLLHKAVSYNFEPFGGPHCSRKLTETGPISSSSHQPLSAPPKESQAAGNLMKLF